MHHKGFVLLGVLVMSLGMTQAALAHAELEEAVPAPGAVVEKIEEIRLTFSEPISEATIRLLRDQTELNLVVSITGDTVMGSFADELEEGVYQVLWTAVSADGHEISGSYSFEYKPSVSRTRYIIGVFLIVASITLFIAALIYRRRLSKKKGVAQA